MEPLFALVALVLILVIIWAIYRVAIPRTLPGPAPETHHSRHLGRLKHALPVAASFFKARTIGVLFDMREAEPIRLQIAAITAHTGERH